MLAGDFARRLRKLNRHLNVVAGNDDSKPAGVYFVTPHDDYEEVCGVDKNWVPEYTEWDSKGHIVKSGWRRVLKILLAKKLVNRLDTYKVFGHWDEHRAPTSAFFHKEMTPVEREIAHIANRGYWHRDELIDVGREIAKGKVR